MTDWRSLFEAHDCLKGYDSVLINLIYPEVMEALQPLMAQMELNDSADFNDGDSEQLNKAETIFLDAATSMVSRLASHALDPLTGLMNRRTFISACLQENNAEASIDAMLLFDADHFKRLNDRWGHDAGDECLKLIADVLRIYSASTGCITARWGGEEFVVFMPDCSAQKAEEISDSIRREIGKVVSLQENLPDVTVSGGLSVMEGSVCRSKLESLINFADSALIRAKKNGRNRVELHQQEMEPGKVDLKLDAESEGFVIVIGPKNPEELRINNGSRAISRVNSVLRRKLGRRPREKSGDLIVSFLKMSQNEAVDFLEKLISAVPDVEVAAGITKRSSRMDADIRDAVLSHFCTRLGTSHINTLGVNNICLFEPEVLESVGSTFLERGDYRAALPLLQEAYSLGVKTSRNMCNLAAALEMSDRDDEALRILEQADELFENLRPEILSNMATIYLRVGKHSEGEMCYRRLLELRSQCPKTLNNLAEAIRAGDGDLSEAAGYAAEAVRLGAGGPYEHFYLDTLGMLLFMLDNIDEAENLLEKAVSLTANGEVRQHLAIVKRVKAGRKLRS